MGHRARRMGMVLALSLLGAGAAVRGDIVAWNNPGGGAWTDATWTPHAPNNGDDVLNTLIGAPIQFFGTSINVNSFLSASNFSILSGQFGGSQVGSASPVEVDGSFLVDGGGLVNLTVNPGIGGTFGYSANANNFFSGVILNTNVTPATNGYVQLFGGNTLNGTWNLADVSNGIQFHDGSTVLTVSSTGEVRGFGATFNFFGGGTLVNNGVVTADTSGQTLSMQVSNLSGNGTFSATGGGVLSIGGVINGSSATISVDNNPASAVLIDGGGVTGSYISGGGNGFSFSGNGNNFISNADIGCNVTMTGVGYAQIFNSNTISGTLAMAGTSNGIQFHDGSAVLTVTGTMRGFGLTYNFFGGGTLLDNGLVSADVSGQTLTLNNSNIGGSGVFEGKNGGTLAIGGTLNGSGATVHGDSGTVIIDGGGVTGSFAASTGSGISFSGNGNNVISLANVNGNMSVAGVGYVQVFNTNSVGGTIAMSGTSNGIQFHDGSALLTLTSSGTLRGFGLTYDFFGGGTLTNDGLVSADVSGQSLTLNNSNIGGGGVFEGKNGGTLAIGGTLNGSNATVHGDTGTVLVDGGGITGTYGASTGSGISFSGNGNNRFFSANVNGNLTVSGVGYVQIFNTNTVSGTIAMSGTANGIQFHDGGALLALEGAGTLRGFGTTYNFFGGGTLTNDGLVSADVGGQALTLAHSVTNGTGTFEGKNGGILVIDTALVGTNATVHGDSGTVLVDGGSVSGTFAAATGTGFSFSGSGGNAISNAVINGNLTVAGVGYVQVFGGLNVVAGTIAMSGTGNGIQFHDGGAVLTLAPSAIMHGFGTTYDFFGGGQLVNHGTIAADAAGQTLALNNSVVTTDGHITVATAATMQVGQSFSQSGGETSVDGSLVVLNPFTITGGVLDGNGTVTGNVINSGGTVSPGHSPALLIVAGNYEQDTGGTLAIELGGTTAGVSYDQLGTVNSNIAGTLNVSLINGFVPIVGNTFDVLTYGSRSGTFDTLASGTGGLLYHVDYLSDRARITIDAVPTVPEPGTLMLLGLPLLMGRRRRISRGVKV